MKRKAKASVDNLTNNRPRILIVDDEEGIRTQLAFALGQEYEVLEAYDKETALKATRAYNPSLVVLDVSLIPGSIHGTEGMELLREIIAINPRTKVIMITANDERHMMLDAIERGASDYYVKPINLEEIKVMFKRALHLQKLEEENVRLSNALFEENSFEKIIGSCEKMEKIFSLVRKVAPTDATVLITGESGTGKELAARALHYASARKEHPFKIINCGAIPENLLESELFGHEKGAFTDAYIQKIGKFELAHGGTIFLDEIGELSLPLQVKLLRFLQEHVIERVGGNKLIELDVRIIAATNSDLKQKITEGTFREDLFYRLSVVNIIIPPLRERNDDKMLLANYYLQKIAQESHKKIKGFTHDAITAINEYPWPGNVRELENKIKRAVILAVSQFISSRDLGIEVGGEIQPEKLKDARGKLDLRYIKEALIKHRGNISRAAREVGISRVSFYDLMRKYGIK